MLAPYLHHESGAPAAFDYGIGSWPLRQARIRPRSLALRQGRHALTYAELADNVVRLAIRLAGRGVTAGDRVAYLGHNTIAAFELFFAVCRLGAVFVPLNTRLSAPEIDVLLDDCRPVALFHDSGQPSRTARLLSAKHPAVVATLDDEIAAAARTNPNRAASYTTDVNLDHDAVILYTSGTTGHPKGAALTHANLTFNTMNQLAHVDVLSSDVALCAAPLYHATGLAMVTLPTLFKGGTVVMAPRFDPADILATIVEHRVCSFAAVPTMLRMLCEHPDFPHTDLGSLRYIIYGGSPATEHTVEQWRQRGVVLLQGYGMTEASPGVTLALPDHAGDRPLSAGVPHFFTDIALDTARGSVGDQHAGELLVRGLNLARAYWNRDDLVGNSGWFRSGDVVHVRPDGDLYVLDRIKDMIISGGENIMSTEVEAALRALPGVGDCAVIGVPDQRWGEVGAAYIETDDETWTASRVRNALRENIAAFKVPKHIVFTPELPRNATGKIDKTVLRAQFQSGPALHS